MSAREHVRRVCQDVVDAEARLEEARRAYEADPHNAPLRFKANDAWNALKRAEKAMCELTAVEVLEAVAATERRECVMTKKRQRFTLDEVLSAIAAIEDGETAYAVSQRTGRKYNSLITAIGRYKAGTSALVEEAKRLGVWEGV